MILALQASQLSVAASTFADSVASLERDLESIAARVQEMAEGGRSLLGASTGEQDSFFLQMEGSFTSILKLLDTCTGARAGMGETAGRLEETIARMRESVAEIRGIEIRIQRIATNAAIRACHIGANGNALDVVAVAMQRLAAESNAGTEAVAGALDAMSGAAARVAGRGGSGAAQESAGSGEVAPGMTRAIGELHSSSESSFARVHQIAALGTRLAADARSVRAGFTAGPMVAEVVRRAMRELEGLAAQAGAAPAEGAGAEAAEAAVAPHLESLASRYTMQHERDVHDAVVRRETGEGGTREVREPVLVASGESTGGDDGLGDNVELF